MKQRQIGVCQRKALPGAAGIALMLLGWAPQASASMIDYTFQVTVADGPLAGQVKNGSFSYDSSSIISGQANSATGLLTALNFTFNGISYSAATANTGGLVFNASGNLIYAVFGSNCSRGGCSIDGGANEFFIDGSLLNYAVLDGGSIFDGTVAYSETPVSVLEPSSFALLGTSIFAVGVVRLRRRGKYATSLKNFKGSAFDRGKGQHPWP